MAKNEKDRQNNNSTQETTQKIKDEPRQKLGVISGAQEDDTE